MSVTKRFTQIVKVRSCVSSQTRMTSSAQINSQVELIRLIACN